MSVKWPVFIIMMFVIGAVICSVIEFTFVTSGTIYSQHTNNCMMTLMNSFNGISFTNPLVALSDILIGIGSITQVFFQILLWDYSFFTGGYEIVKYVVFWPLSIGFFLALMLSLRGTSSA